MKTRLSLTLIVSICAVMANAQNLWQEMPNGEDFFDMRCIYQDTSTGILYAGGSLWNQIIGGDTVNCITYWNGTKWDHMADGITPNGNIVSSIINYQGHIYASGVFASNNGCPGTSIMVWNDSVWHPVGDGFCEGTNKVYNCCGSIAQLMEFNGLLYALGNYDTIGCLLGNGIATWNGSTWSSDLDFLNTFPNAGNPDINRMCIFNNQIYVAGGFHSVDSSGKDLAYYDGVAWHTVGGGLYGSLSVPFDMIPYKGKVYIAGRFKKSEGNPGNNIASWDGTEWNDLDGGTDGQIFDLLIYHDKLYAFGGFTHAGGVSASQMACWDGSKWCGINHNFTTAGISHAGIYNDTILVSGRIFQGNDTLRYFSKFLGGDYVDTCGATVSIPTIIQATFDFSLSPNPATTQLQITFLSTNQPHHLKLINTLGQTIQQQTFSANQLQLDISTLPSGVYFIELQDEKGRAVKKFVKE